MEAEEDEFWVESEIKWRRRQLVRPVGASSQSAGDVQTSCSRLKVFCLLWCLRPDQLPPGGGSQEKNLPFGALGF